VRDKKRYRQKMARNVQAVRKPEVCEQPVRLQGNYVTMEVCAANQSVAILSSALQNIPTVSGANKFAAGD
jgi:hypothetical protein